MLRFEMVTHCIWSLALIAGGQPGNTKDLNDEIVVVHSTKQWRPSCHQRFRVRRRHSSSFLTEAFTGRSEHTGRNGSAVLLRKHVTLVLQLVRSLLLRLLLLLL